MYYNRETVSVEKRKNSPLRIKPTVIAHKILTRDERANIFPLKINPIEFQLDTQYNVVLCNRCGDTKKKKNKKIFDNRSTRYIHIVIFVQIFFSTFDVCVQCVRRLCPRSLDNIIIRKCVRGEGGKRKNSPSN